MRLRLGGRRVALGAGCASGTSGAGAHTDTVPAASPRTPSRGAGSVNGLAQVHNLIGRDPHATIHGGGLFLVELA